MNRLDKLKNQLEAPQRSRFEERSSRRRLRENVADTIVAQLGGMGKLKAMIGAKDFLAGADSVQFAIGSGAKNKIRKIRIVLAPDDTYTVTFHAGTGANMKQVGEVSDVYADALKRTIEAETGMYLSL